MEKHDDPKKQTAGSELVPYVPAEELTPRDYLRQVKIHLSKGRQKEAFGLLQQANVHFPDDPFILSYYGCLQALVDKRYRTGIETCKKALALARKTSSFGEEILYPVFYLNLGRAYVAAGKKKDALETFHKGLKFDNTNRDLQKEVRALGKRKAAPVPFLDRSNPINKYIGMILRKSSKTAEKK
jgi:tetratricopeptide (TPR) repeat protein